MSRRFGLALLLLALAFAPGIAGAQDDTGSLEQLVAETAHTKAEHQALATHYAGKAAEARALASRHQSMGRAYLGSKGMNKQAFTTHCNRIAEQQKAMAVEFDALAKLHEQEAATSQ